MIEFEIEMKNENKNENGKMKKFQQHGLCQDTLMI